MWDWIIKGGIRLYNLTRKLVIAATMILLSTCALAEYDPNNFDPHNAAHWYRKAFALYEEPNDVDLSGYIGGDIELTPKIEQFLKKQKTVIDLITKATQIEHCDWEYDSLAEELYSSANNTCSTISCIDNIICAKKITILLIADARYKEMKGQHQRVHIQFEPALQLSLHIDSEDLLNHLVSLSLRMMSYNAIREYLNRHPDCRLTDLYNAELFLKKESKRQRNYTLTGEIQYMTEVLTDYKKYVYSDKLLTETWGVPIKKLSKDFYKRNLDYYRNYMLKQQEHFDLPYPQAIQKNDELWENFREKARKCFSEYGDPFDYRDRLMMADVNIEDIEKCDFLFTMIAGPYCTSVFSIDVRVRTELNALQAGIDLLIRYRSTKKIPERLPSNSPKDLFSDKPFLIIKTENGFNLKCQGEDLHRNNIYEYEFLLRKRHASLSSCNNSLKPAGKDIEIRGSKAFREQVNKSLKLLKNKAPDAYGIVIHNVGRIEQGKHSGMWAYKTPPTFELNDRTAFCSITWCASSIAHDSYHSKL